MKRWEVPGGVRFITCSCQRRLPLFSNPGIAGLFVDAMVRARRKFGLELFAWVVMPEHIHMLVRPAESVPLGPALHSLKMTVSKRVIPRWVARRASILDRIADGQGRPRFWQKGGGFDRNVRDDGEFCREVRYIHRNPVERGLVARPEEWRWSSVRWWMGLREGEVECDPPPGNPRSWLNWKGSCEVRRRALPDSIDQTKTPKSQSRLRWHGRQPSHVRSRSSVPPRRQLPASRGRIRVVLPSIGSATPGSAAQGVLGDSTHDSMMRGRPGRLRILFRAGPTSCKLPRAERGSGSSASSRAGS
ncbi:MAG: hypothetical protein GIKADHBN_01027 [Phycisphaerales bacterium]|nr:hypothetical protein [Phycisphaerales bacterium]